MAKKKQAAEHADKRSVHTDALETLGMLIDDTQRRDAIHLAVEPAIAGEPLSAGDHVGFLADGRVGRSEKPLGIVDPFLAGPVQEGDMFWLVVYPRKINSLRHVWEHSDFPASGETGVSATEKALVATSREWIEKFASSYDRSYDEVMRVAASCAAGNYDYITGGAEMEGESVPDEFWTHYEKVTGTSVKEDNRNSFFSCSC